MKLPTTLNENQKAVLLAIAGFKPYTGQSNHRIAGETALERRGLIKTIYSEDRVYVTVALTDEGVRVSKTLRPGE